MVDGQEIFAEAAGARFRVRRVSAIAALPSGRASADMVFVENDGKEKGLRCVDRSPAGARRQYSSNRNCFAEINWIEVVYLLIAPSPHRFSPMLRHAAGRN